MRLDGYGLFVNDMPTMIRFYRDVLGFAIKEDENTSNVYLVKDGTLFLLYGREDFEKLTSKKYAYLKGVNAHSEMALYVDTFEEVDVEYQMRFKTARLRFWNRRPSRGGSAHASSPTRRGMLSKSAHGISRMRKKICKPAYLFCAA